MVIQRCDLSDLPVEQCACRKHRPGQEIDALPAYGTPGPVATARYAGRCPACGEAYDLGDQIRLLRSPGGGRWLHAGCAEG